MFFFSSILFASPSGGKIWGLRLYYFFFFFNYSNDFCLEFEIKNVAVLIDKDQRVYTTSNKHIVGVVFFW